MLCFGIGTDWCMASRRMNGLLRTCRLDETRRSIAAVDILALTHRVGSGG